MKKSFKIGILVLVLFVPIFIFFFLREFGKNHYRLPIYYPLEVAGSDTIYHTIPDFEFTSQRGIAMKISDFQQNVLIVDFFFTRCPGICPKMSSQLSRVQENINATPTVKILSISVDPDYDVPTVLKQYGDLYNANDTTWYFAHMPKNEVFNIGFYGFKLPADTLDKTLHSEKMVLLDKQRRVRGYYCGTDTKEVDRMITEAKILEYEYSAE